MSRLHCATATASWGGLSLRLTIEEITMVIASRVLALQDADLEIEIPIRIFAPELKKASWLCRYEIDWPEGTQAMEAEGIDSVQALVVALQMIGADVYSSNYHKLGKLALDVSGNGYGFPVVSSLRDLLEGDDAKYL
jgi:hypothetical protein